MNILTFTLESCKRESALGAGVIWTGIPIETPVIPAKAGIQPADRAFAKVREVDSRFHGNDCGLQRPRVANDASSLRLGFPRRGEPQAFLSTVANKSPATQEADQCKSALASQLDR